MSALDTVRRIFEIEDPTNLYLIHPISAVLVPVFARAGITPNQVSFLGMACGLLAGLCYHFYHLTGCDLAGFALMLGWHVMDGADGQLARLTKTYSELGKILDGICDYVTFAAVYIGLGLTLSTGLGGWVWAVIAISGICHALQSAAYELQRQNYHSWGLGKQSAAPAQKPVAGAFTRHRIAAQLNRAYIRVQLWAGGASGFHTAFAAMLAANPAAEADIRDAYRAFIAPIIRRWGVLSANYRTLAIFFCALVKLPLLYFLFEIFGFTAILLLLLAAQQAQNAAFLERLRPTQRPRQPFMPTLQQPGA